MRRIVAHGRRVHHGIGWFRQHAHDWDDLSSTSGQEQASECHADLSDPGRRCRRDVEPHPQP
jgi:hypothetical protein